VGRCGKMREGMKGGREEGRKDELPRERIEKDGGFREDKTISCLSVPVYGE